MEPPKSKAFIATLMEKSIPEVLQIAELETLPLAWLMYKEQFPDAPVKETLYEKWFNNWGRGIHSLQIESYPGQFARQKEREKLLTIMETLDEAPTMNLTEESLPGREKSWYQRCIDWALKWEINREI